MEQVSIVSAYMWALIIMAVFFLIAVLVSNMIPYKPNDPGTTSRRIWFWVLCVLAVIVGFVINFFAVAGNITVPSLHTKYLLHSSIAAGVALVLYILFGVIVSKLFPKAKVGTWF